MAQSLKDLQVLRTVLGRLNAERPALGEEQEGFTKYVQREGDFLRRLDLEVTSRQGKARVLITGQIGVGKSSELNWYFYKNRGIDKKTFWIFCDLEKEENPEKCSSTAVFLSIFRDTWRSTITYFKFPSRNLNQLRDSITSELIDWLNGEIDEEKELVNFKFGGMDYPIYLNEENKNKALVIMLGKAAQHEAVSKPSERFSLAPDTLVNLLNRLLTWLTEECGKLPVLLIDHVDKIRSSEAAEDVLIKAVPHWNRIKASIIMTAPFESTLGELRYSVESKWGKPLMLYPVAIPELDGSSVPEIYGKIIKNANLHNLTDKETLKIFAHYSGGILRTFVQFLIQGCKEAYLVGHDSIRKSDALKVIREAERAYQDYNIDALRLLDQIDKQETGLGESAVLLRSPIGLLVAEPDDNKQNLRVHPLAMATLERFRASKNRV